MSVDDIIYIFLLLGCIAFGYFYRQLDNVSDNVGKWFPEVYKNLFISETSLPKTMDWLGAGSYPDPCCLRTTRCSYLYHIHRVCLDYPADECQVSEFLFSQKD